MKQIIQVILVALLVFYGIHFNMEGSRHKAQVDDLNGIISGLEMQNRKLSDKVAQVETRSRVRDYFDTRHVGLSPRELKAVTDSILRVSDRYDLSPDLIMALIETESAFNKNAISEKGAVGLMQLLPSTAADLARDLKIEWEGEQLLHDPGLNIEMGACYLNQLLERFNDMDSALAAYNMGPNRVDQIHQLGLEKPRRYARQVQHNLEKIEQVN